MKRIISVMLTVVILCGMAVLPAGAVSSTGFKDITDSTVADAAETLRLLGIVQGTGDGTFEPDGTFTRAAFCKMAILTMNRGGDVALQQGRVIFSDVTSSYWALGYINAAATGTSPLIRGVGDGSFKPDEAITYGQAVTILMRVLGYADTDVSVGGLWYTGYLTMADTIGLTKGVTAGGEDVITRGQAAILFNNLLYTKPKGGTSVFLSATLGGSIVEDAMILSVTDTTLKTANKTYETNRTGLFAQSLKGYTVDLYLDAKGKVLSVQLDETNTGTNKTYVLQQIERTRVKTVDGTTIVVSPTTEFWKNGVQTTYADVYLNLTSGATVTFYYDAEGSIVRMFLAEDGKTVTNGFITSTAATNPFSFLTGADTGFTIVKNGVSAKLSDLRLYDVGSYNKDTQVLTVCDEKITGIYEAATPTPNDPATITVMGKDFTVLSCALDSLSTVKVGDVITLLLDSSNQVAGVVSAETVSTTTIGILTSVSYPTITVTTTGGVELKGKVTIDKDYVELIKGKLITVTQSKKGELNVSRINDKGVSITGSWNVAQKTLGNLTVSPSVAVYERVGDSKLFAVGLSNVTVSTVSADDITYVSTDYAGRVDVIILENVTGDCYTYGLLSFKKEGLSVSLSDLIAVYDTVTADRGETDSLTLISSSGKDFSSMKGKAVGIVGSLSSVEDTYRMTDLIELTAIANVPRSAFGEDVVTIDGVEYPLADNVKCYNADSEKWFASLTEARAYSARLTVYYDKPLAEGGKIRLVVAGELK